MAERKAMDRLQSFVRTNDGEWVQSPETKRVLDIMQANTSVPINIEVAPSPMMFSSGKPAWGSGEGVFKPNTGRAFIDPFAHPTVAAHEAAHQAFMSDLGQQYTYDDEYVERLNKQLADPKNYSSEMIDKGATMRLGYEAYDKPFLIEEANAQGVAQAAMDRAGIPVITSGWDDMYEYPEAYTFGGPFSEAVRMYKEGANRPGFATLTPAEAAELGAIQRASSPAVRRQFDLGYQRIQ